jgi:hypothetical protein
MRTFFDMVAPAIAGGMPPGRRGRGKVAPLQIILGPDGEINAPEPKAVLSWSGGQDARNSRKKPSTQPWL